MYASEITTCTGKTIADLIGWKYADMQLQWDTLPESQLNTLLDMTGENTIEFEDADGVVHTETIIRTSAVNTATRFSFANNSPVWSNVTVEVKFINVHHD